MDESTATHVAKTIGAMFRDVHDQFRELVERLDVDALN